MLQKALKIYLASIFLFLLVLNSLSYAQSTMDSLSPKVKTIVQTIALRNEIMDRAVSVDGHMPEQWKSFDSLKKLASTNELYSLMKHPNTVVRGYVFWELTERKDTSLFSIFSENISDTSTFQYLFGCNFGNAYLTDFYISLLTGTELYEETLENVNSLMTNEQKEALDSILISVPNNLKSKNKVLLNMYPNENYYDAIRMLALLTNPYAKVALSRYKKPEDIDIILNYVPRESELLFLAIAQNPGDEYKAFMQRFSDSINVYDRERSGWGWKEYYSTLTKFDNDFALSLINQGLNFVIKDKDIQKDKLEFIFLAMANSDNPIYDSLLFNFWEKNLWMTQSAFNCLWERDSLRCISILKKSLPQIDKIRSNNYSIEHAQRYKHRTSDMIAYMFYKLYGADKDFTTKLIIKDLRDLKSLSFTTILDAIKLIKDEKFLQPLLNSLKSKKSEIDLLRVIQAIASYERPDINKEILPTLRQNDFLVERDVEYEFTLFDTYEKFLNETAQSKYYNQY